MYTNADLAAKSEAELGEIAQLLGLKLNIATSSKNDVITAILAEAGADGDDLEEEVEEIEDDLEEEVVVAKAPKKRATKAATAPVKTASGKKRIIVHNQEGNDAGPFVKVGLNGVMYAIPRDVEVIVPDGVVGVLSNAIVTRTTQEGRQTVERSAPRHPFTVLGDA
jgi:hypothetical protein